MCLSIFLAQVIGCYLFFVSLAMLIHQNRYKKVIHDLLSTPALVTLTGVVTLILGLLIVRSHNLWTTEWPVIVTLFGWFLLLQALMRIFFPELFVKWMKELTAKSGYVLVSWVWLLIGVYLLWASYTP
jgi:uncharacterized protein YacL